MAYQPKNLIEVHMMTILNKGGISLLVSPMAVPEMERLCSEYGLVSSIEEHYHRDEVLMNIAMSQEALEEYLRSIPF